MSPLGEKLLMQDLQTPLVEGWVVAVQAAVQVEAGDEQQKGQDTCRLWGAAGFVTCTCCAAFFCLAGCTGAGQQKNETGVALTSVDKAPAAAKVNRQAPVCLCLGCNGLQAY